MSRISKDKGSRTKLFSGMLYALLASATDAWIGKHHPIFSLVGSEIVRLSQIHEAFDPPCRHSKRNRNAFLELFLCRAVTLPGYIYGFRNEYVILKYWALENLLQYLNGRSQLQDDDEDNQQSRPLQRTSCKFLALGYWLAAILIYYFGDTGGLLLLFCKVFVTIVPSSVFLIWLLIQIETPFGRPIARGDVFAIPKAIIYILQFGFEWAYMKYEVLMAKFHGQLLPELSLRIAYRQRRRYHSHDIPSHTYKPLPTCSPHIRLLEIQRGNSLSGIITAKIKHVTIDDAPCYEALSYCWGTAPPSEEILIDGQLFALRKSAYDFLYSRRSLWRRTLVWCDAICINQDDAIEKSYQVGLMTEIYRRATGVVVWPGGDWTTHLAGAFILRISHAYHKYKDDEFSKFLYRNKFRPHWQAVVRLFKNEYFNRVWIIQETSVNPCVHIHHGRVSIPWDTYQEVLRECHQERRRMLLVDPNWSQMSQTSSENLAIEHAAILSALRRDDKNSIAQWKLQLDFSNLSFACRKFHATNPADKVYALVGIAVDGQNDLLKPDYTKELYDVYKDAACFAISHGQNPFLTLGMAGIGWNRQLHELPSWAPDLTAALPHFPLTLPTSNVIFRAGRDRSSQIRFSADDKQLHIRGVVFDTILDTPGGTSKPFQGRTLNEAQQSASEDPETSSWEEVCGVLDFPKEFPLKGSVRFNLNFHDAAHDTALRHKSLWRSEAELETNFRMALIGAYRLHRNFTSYTPDEIASGYPQWLTLTTLLSDASITNAEIIEKMGRESAENLLSLFSREAILARSYSSAMADACHRRRFCITERGFMALVPPGAQKGDKVAVFLGAQTPFVLRRTEGENQGNVYRLVGEGYVHGVMDGEALQLGEEETITIV